MAAVAKYSAWLTGPGYRDQRRTGYVPRGLIRWGLISLLLIGIAAALLALSGPNSVLPDTSSPAPLSTATGPTTGETYRWQPVAIGAGGFMVGLSSDRAGSTFVARTDVHGAYIWRPELDQWVQLVTDPAMPPAYRTPASMFGGVAGIVVAPSDGQRLYMAVKGTVFRSEDQGKSWQVPDTGPFPVRFGAKKKFLRSDPVLAVSPDNPDIVYFGTAHDGVLRSTDGGRNWARVDGLPATGGTGGGADADVRPALIWFAPAEGGTRATWILVQGVGMFVSEQEAGGFTPLRGQGAAAPRMLSSGAFTSDGRFFGTDPDGKTIWRYQQGEWTNLAADGVIDDGSYQTVAVSPHNDQLLAFEHNGSALRSIDGGASWSTLRKTVQVGEKDPPWLRIADQNFFATSQVMFDPIVRDRLWVTAGVGLFRADVPPDARSIDWVSRSRGIEELVANDVVQSPGRAPLFAAWDFGIHVKADLDVFSSGFGPKEQMIIAAQQLALTPADPNFVATNASDTSGCCPKAAVLAGYSEDAGRTWQRFGSLPHPPGTKKDDPWRMAWGMIAVSSGNPDNIIWAPSLNRAPFYTRDRGRNWTLIHFPGEKPPFTGSHVKKHLQRKVLVADPVKDGTFYLVHSGNPDNRQLMGLWRTQDGGSSWTRLFQGEIAPKSENAAKLRAMPGRSGDLFFTSAVEGTHDSRLRRSTDGGVTWQIIPGVDQVSDITFGKAASGNTVPTIYLAGFVHGKYGIWRSVDNAQSWSRLAVFPIGRLDRVVVLGADPDIFGRLYIGWQGSGWTYGAPAACQARPVRPFDIAQCYKVDRP